MCECRYYGKCAGNCDGYGLVLGFGNETYDCDYFSPLPDIDALLALADEIEGAVRNEDTTTYLAARFAEVIYTIAKEIRSACSKTGTYVHMVTDDERRSAAEKLRRLADGYTTIGDMEDALGICMSSPDVDLERNARDLHRLADLIDPTCKACRDTLFYPDTGLTPEHEETIYRCSSCGQILTYDADFDPETDSPAYCESCGSRVTGIGEPWDE